MSLPKSMWPIVAVVALALGAVGGYVIASGPSNAPHATSTGASESEPVVPVKLVTLKKQKMEETLTAYGAVVTAPGESVTVSVNYEARVKRLRVAAGQYVEVGTPLVELEPSSDTRLRFTEARQEVDAARAALALAKQRLGLGLATRSDVLKARQRLSAAESRTHNLASRGSRGQVIKAKQAGIVSRIDVETGAIAAPGAALLQMIDRDQIAVRLGVESEDVRHIHDGMPVRLFPVNLNLDKPIEGKVYLVSREVDPQTRLVDVFVAPTSTDRLMLNMYMRGEVVIGAQRTLVAPRAAVLPTDGGYRIFTVEKGRAKVHKVALGMQNDGSVEIVSTDLSSGDRVITVGNSEVSDGTAVVEEHKR